MTCEAIWIKRLLKDLQVEVSDPTTIYCDNLSSIQLVKNPVFHARTKHIEMHYHFVHKRVLSGAVELVYVMMDRQTPEPLGLDKLHQFFEYTWAATPQHSELEGEKGKERK